MRVVKQIYLFFSNSEVRAAIAGIMGIMLDYLQGELDAEVALENVIGVITKAVIR